MNVEDLKVGNILVRDRMFWGISRDSRDSRDSYNFFRDRYSFYRITKVTPKAVFLDHLEVEYKDVLMKNCPEDHPIWEIEVGGVTDRVLVSYLKVCKRIACSEYELYDPDKSYRLD